MKENIPPMKDDLVLEKQRFFSFLSSLPRDDNAINWKEVIFVCIEKKQTDKGFFFADFTPITTEVLQHNRISLETTTLAELSLFCNLPNGNRSQDNYNIEYNGAAYFARPLTFWLSPVGFFLFPVDRTDAAEIEQFFKRMNGFLHEQLWLLLECRVENFFSTEKLLELSRNKFQQHLFLQISSFINPRVFQTSHATYAYATQLFSTNEETPKLSITIGAQVHFLMPPIASHISNTIFEWEYSQDDLILKKRHVSTKLNSLCHKYIERYDSLQQVAFDKGSLPTLIKRFNRIKKNIKKLKSDLEDISHKMNLTPQGSFMQDTHNRFYLSGPKTFTIYFDGMEIAGMTYKPSRLFHTLISSPNQAFDMYLLYAMLNEDKAKASTKKELSMEDKEWKMLQYIKHDLIKLNELEAARQKGTLFDQDYERRLEAGIRLLEKAVKAFPGLDLKEYLIRYQLFRRKYFDNVVLRGFMVEAQAEIPPKEVRNLSNKTARERLTAPISSFYKKLKRNPDHRRFFQYLNETIKRDIIDGVHYYTFRPEAANKEEWRQIQWKLDP